MRGRWPLFCAAFLLAWWALLAIAPRYRESWLHENLLVFASVPGFVLLHRRRLLSDASWTLITLALALHLVGAHYTYSEVPLFDRPSGRNHYDRVVHFSFGLLLALPARELVARGTGLVRGASFVALLVILAGSMLYEIVEWAFVLVADPAAGTAFLGAQGDPWDAQKDMALAGLGGLLALLTTHVVQRRRSP